MRLIDAEKLIHELSKSKVLMIVDSESNYNYMRQSDVFKIVDSIPTIEVRKKGRYIDAEELKHILNNSKYYGTKAGNAFADMITECESIKERKKGKWIWGDGVMCSNCCYKLQTTGLPSRCPNCGADMIGE